MQSCCVIDEIDLLIMHMTMLLLSSSMFVLMQSLIVRKNSLSIMHLNKITANCRRMRYQNLF